jgi:hypothetical protein
MTIRGLARRGSRSMSVGQQRIRCAHVTRQFEIAKGRSAHGFDRTKKAASVARQRFEAVNSSVPVATAVDLRG